jgi:predicted MFS family arabinose efflux permease
MQHSVDGAIRGRVLSLYGMLHRGVPALGALLMGIMGDQIGLQATLIGGALIFCVPVFFWVLLRWRRLRSALEGPPIEA